jgi:hypothetical protein
MVGADINDAPILLDDLILYHQAKWWVDGSVDTAPLIVICSEKALQLPDGPHSSRVVLGRGPFAADFCIVLTRVFILVTVLR